MRCLGIDYRYCSKPRILVADQFDLAAHLHLRFASKSG
jgi:hypothetical protein